MHFPIPWDKKPHRRVMSISFINECMRILKVTGTLELRTDSSNYFEYSSSLLKNFTQYPTEIFKNKDLDVTSKYEARWKKQEKDIWDIVISSVNESPAVQLTSDFLFPGIYNIDRIKNNIPKKTFLGEKYLVNFENWYDIDLITGYKASLVKVTLGSFSRPVTKYLFLENNKVRYFQGEPIKTRVNLEAHQKVLEILK